MADKPVRRRLRHWKQQFDPQARFIFLRETRYGSQIYEVGDEIPDDLFRRKGKLRAFWEARRIGLAQFDEKSGKGIKHDDPLAGVDIPEGVAVEKGKGSWFAVTFNGETKNCNGKVALITFLDICRTEIQKAEAKAAAQANASLVERLAPLGFELAVEDVEAWDDTDFEAVASWVETAEAAEIEEGDPPEILHAFAVETEDDETETETETDDDEGEDTETSPAGDSSDDEDPTPDDEKRPLEGTETDDGTDGGQ